MIASRAMNIIESSHKYKETVRILYLPKQQSLSNPVTGRTKSERTDKTLSRVDFWSDGYWGFTDLLLNPKRADANKALNVIMKTAPLLPILINRYEHLQRQHLDFLGRNFWAMWTILSPSLESLSKDKSSALTSIPNACSGCPKSDLHQPPWIYVLHEHAWSSVEPLCFRLYIVTISCLWKGMIGFIMFM